MLRIQGKQTGLEDIPKHTARVRRLGHQETSLSFIERQSNESPDSDTSCSHIGLLLTLAQLL